MKIKFLRDVKYPQNNAENSREYKAGEVVDCAPDHAHRWIRRNAAVEFVPEKVSKKSKPDDEPEVPKSTAAAALVPAAPVKG